MKKYYLLYICIPNDQGSEGGFTLAYPEIVESEDEDSAVLKWLDLVKKDYEIDLKNRLSKVDSHYFCSFFAVNFVTFPEFYEKKPEIKLTVQTASEIHRSLSQKIKSSIN